MVFLTIKQWGLYCFLVKRYMHLFSGQKNAIRYILKCYIFSYCIIYLDNAMKLTVQHYMIPINNLGSFH